MISLLPSQGGANRFLNKRFQPGEASHHASRGVGSISVLFGCGNSRSGRAAVVSGKPRSNAEGGPPSRTTEDVVGAERTTEKVHFVDQPVEPPPVASRTSPLDGATQDKRAVAVRDVFVNGPVNDGP